MADESKTPNPVVWPHLSGRALDGEPYQLPGDLHRRHTFLIVAFRREQQALVDQWLPWLLAFAQRSSDMAVYEVPVLSTAYRPARWFIDGGMARGVGSDSARARTITIYTDVGKLVSALGLPGTETIAVLLIERSGRILATELGGFDQQKAKRLADARRPQP